MRRRGVAVDNQRVAPPDELDTQALRNTIAANLQAIAGGQRGWQTALARATGQRPVSVHRWSTAKITPPLTWLIQVAQLYQTTLDRLVTPDHPPVEQAGRLHYFMELKDDVRTGERVEYIIVRQGDELTAVKVKNAPATVPQTAAPDTHSDAQHDAP